MFEYLCKRAPQVVSWWTITTTPSVERYLAWMDEAQVRLRTRSHIGCSSEKSKSSNNRLIKGQSYDNANRGANTQGRYKNSSENCGWGRVFWTTDRGEYKTADLIRELKRRFGLVVRLIANKCYEDTFHFLFFLPLPSGLLNRLVPFVIRFLFVRLVEVVGRRHWNHPASLLCIGIRQHPDLFRAHDPVDQLSSHLSPTELLGRMP